MAQRLYVPTATMIITLMLVRRTAITAQIGSSAECLSAPAPGITATTGAVTMGEAGTGAGSAATGIMMAGAVVSSTVIADGAVVASFMRAAGSVVTAGFMVKVGSTEVVDSMEEADFTVVAATEAIAKELGL